VVHLHPRKILTEDDNVTAMHDQCCGSWTRLALIEMDVRFCQAVQRAHPE
jgi:hypothetical protein